MSSSLDTVAPYFLRMVERWSLAPTLINHYQAVVESFEGNQHGLVETVKSFVECVCLTILGEYGKPMPTSNPSTTDMFVEALRLLGLQNTRDGGNLSRLLSAHNKLADALSEMRDGNGPIAHGKDGFLDTLSQNHLRTYLLTADTLLALLLAALDGTEPDIQFTREPYERFSHLHDRIDSSVRVESSVEYEEDSSVLVVNMKTNGLPDSVELRIEPSHLLYAIDRTAYIEVLAASTAEAFTAPPEKGLLAEDVMMVASAVTTEKAPYSKIITEYTGYLSPLTEELQRYLESLNLPEPLKPPAGGNIIDSLLGTAEANIGTDWREREVLQARIKVALRRTLTHFGIPEDAAKKCSEHLVAWLKIQTVGLANDEGGVAQ